MPKARRRAVVALAIVFWVVTLGTFVEALYISPALNPQPTKPDTLSSTVKFSLPSWPEKLGNPPTVPITVTYTVTGEAIMDNAPLTMEILLKIPSVYTFVWTVIEALVMPDNAIAITVLPNGTIFGYDSNLLILSQSISLTTSGYETWTWQSHVLFTSFGVFTSAVEIEVEPTLHTQITDPSVNEFLFTVDNGTSILVESSRTIAATKTATWAAQQEISLTWIIVSLASLDIGFRVYDYSLYEKKIPTHPSAEMP